MSLRIALSRASLALLEASALLAGEAPKPVDFGDRVDAAGAFKLFKEAVYRIWGARDGSRTFLDRIKFDFKMDDKLKVLAALSHPTRYKPKVIGDTLYQASPEYTLILTQRLLDAPTEQVKSVMVHEAVHVGIGNHGADFVRIVRKHGGAPTETAYGKHKPFTVEHKQGARYKPISEHETLEEARRERDRLALANLGQRYRVTY